MRDLRIFHVEDSAIFQATLVEALTGTSTTVVGTAEDEASASAWLESHACDLVIIDLWLRGGNGMRLVRWLHGAPREFKWIVLSSFVNDRVRRAALDLGADGAFDKASDLDAVVAYCDGLAGRSA